MKHNSKKDWRRLLGISMRTVLALVVVGMLVIPVAVQADLKATAVVYAWDIVADKFQNSNVIIPWDGSWVPFLHELNFDTDLWTTPAGDTRWAGDMFYGLYHVDNAPLGAPGFQASRKWSLISCDRDEDGDFDNADLTAPPSPYDRPILYTECLPASQGGTYCVVEDADKDVVTSCTTGNCLTEIVTTIQVNLDLDANGVVDSPFPTDPRTGEPDMLCFYAEARTPTPDQQAGLPAWSNPLQARISTVGGEKTVNFNVSPTAVELAAFDAAAQGNGVLLTWETANEIDNLGFNIYRADSQVGQLVKINPYMIVSQDPGSVAGAAYSFLDESAAPGATYYYWLEDIDASGTATKHGPVTAKTEAAKELPGRRRPPPMPSNAF